MMEQIQIPDEVLAFAKTIQWLGQSTVKITYNGQEIYIDPYQLQSGEKADLILITHDHQDHLSLPDIAKIAGPDTRFVVANSCVAKLEQAGYKNVLILMPGKTTSISGIEISAVPAYNITRQMHPKSKNYVGYILNFNGIKVYHTGDTERVPEMKEVHCDIILLPLGQTYTMTSVDEAAGAVMDTRAKIAIPIHYGLYEGTDQDAVKFGDLMKSKNIIVLPGR